MHVGGTGSHVRAKRGQVVGWSVAAVRRHTRWLYSVVPDDLTGFGWALTLTVGDCPADSAAWTALRHAWIDRVRRMGAVRWHWVVEWQKRGVPHMHCAVYLADGSALGGPLLVRAWLEVCAGTGTSGAAQMVKRIDGPMGWLQYLSKHAARGVQHYQRQGKPAGWETTGRLWGYGGSWPAVEPLEVIVNHQEFYRFRRLVRSWRVADARAGLDRAMDHTARKQALRRLVYARGMLRTSDRALSRYRGVSEWIPEHLALAMLDVACGPTIEGLRSATGVDVVPLPLLPVRVTWGGAARPELVAMVLCEICGQRLAECLNSSGRHLLCVDDLALSMV